MAYVLIDGQTPSAGQSDARGIALDGAGNTYITGVFTFTHDFDPGTGVSVLQTVGADGAPFVAKYDPAGALLWVRTTDDPIGGGSGEDIAIAPDGDLIVTGQVTGTQDFDPGAGEALVGGTAQTAFLARYEADGDLVWAKALSPGQGNAVAVDAAGNILVGAGGNFPLIPIILAKYDAAGNLLWSKHHDPVRDVAFDSNGNVAAGVGNGIARYNSVGTAAAGQHFADYIRPTGLAFDADDNLFVTGTLQSSYDFDPGTGSMGVPFGPFLAKFAPDGTTLWAKPVGSGQLALDPGGNVVVAGNFTGTVDFDPGTGVTSLVGAATPFIARYDTDGNFIGVSTAGTAVAPSSVLSDALAVDPWGNAFVAGEFVGTVDFDPGTGVLAVSTPASKLFVAVYDETGGFPVLEFDPPETTITSGPAATVASQTASFTFESDEVAVFDLVLDGTTTIAGVGEAFTLDGLGEGAHTLSVAARDYSGNVDASPAEHVWTVERSDPDYRLIHGESPSEGYSDARGVALDFAGNTYITGGFAFTHDFDPGPGATVLETDTIPGAPFVAKYDPAGALVWVRTTDHPIGGGSGEDIAIAPDGDLIVTGQVTGTQDFDPGTGVALVGGTAQTAFLARYEADGDLVWAKALSPGQGNAVAVDAAGNILVGASGTFPLIPIILAKYDADGNLLWSKHHDPVRDVAFDSNGNVAAGVGNGIARYNSVGTAASGQHFADYIRPTGLAFDADDNLFVTGTLQSSYDFDPGTGSMLVPFGPFLAKFAPDGSTLWAKPVGSGQLALDPDGNVVVAGEFTGTVDFDPGTGVTSLVGAATPFIARYDTDGNFIGVSTVGTTGPTSDVLPDALTVDGRGYAVIAGEFYGTVDFDPGTGVLEVSDPHNKFFVAVYTDEGVLSPDTVPPDTEIVSGPDALENSADATFAFGADEPAVFDAVLDGTTHAGLADGLTLTGLAQGVHSLSVAARDPSGNVDASPATFTWFIDSIAPETTIASAPPLSTNSTTAAFDFDADETATFDATVDGTLYTGLTDNLTLTGLAEGTYTIAVAARDALGNVDGSPATHVWTVDLTDPDTTIDANPAALSTIATAAFEFSADEDATFDATVDGTLHTALVDGLTLSGLGEGVHSLSVAARDLAGNVDEDPATFTWLVDTVDPDTTITAMPPVATQSTTAAFDFASDETATFDATVDGTSHAGLADGLTVTGLSEGAHTLIVAARDVVGRVDDSPATYVWTVDHTAPETTIDAAPSTLSSESSAIFSFESDEDAVFDAIVDGSAYTNLSEGLTLAGLGEGLHTLSVAARDPAGNVDGTAEAFTWLVDTIDPDTTIATMPPAATPGTTAVFTFTSDEDAEFDVTVDGTLTTDAGAALTLSSLGEGAHTLVAAARDAVGNVDPSPETYVWTVDHTAPDTTIVLAPPSPTNATTAVFDFAADEDALFDVTVDGTLTTGLADGVTLTGLGDGAHSLSVVARDPAGNVDPSAAAHTWTVDTVAPDTTLISGPSGIVPSDSATFVFTSDDPTADLHFAIDGNTFTSAPGTVTFPAAGLDEGLHTFIAAARDPAGNDDPTPVVQTWLVDTAVPDTSILSGPAGPTASRTAVFDFGASEPGVTYEVALDGTVYAPSGDPATFTNLADGAHTLRVRASDLAGQTDVSPATRTWFVDVTAPAAPAVTAFSTDDGEVGDGVTTDRTLAISGTAEAGMVVHVIRDGVEIGTTTATGGGTWSYADPAMQSYGTHLYRAFAEDAAGNESADSAPLSVTVINPAATPGNGNDLLMGTAAANVINGGNGNDSIYGLDGNDTLRGVNGNDHLHGGGGNDRIESGLGADTAGGGNGNDTVLGEGGNDRLSGGNGNDRLEGGADADSIDGGEGADTMFGGPGNDTLVGGNGADRLTGGADPDRIELGDDGARDTVYGTVAELTDDQIDGFVGGAATNPGADVLVIQGLSVANAKKLDGDVVDAQDRLWLDEVGGGALTLEGMAGRQVDTVLGSDGVQLWLV